MRNFTTALNKITTRVFDVRAAVTPFAELQCDNYHGPSSRKERKFRFSQFPLNFSHLTIHLGLGFPGPRRAALLCSRSTKVLDCAHELLVIFREPLDRRLCVNTGCYYRGSKRKEKARPR